MNYLTCSITSFTKIKTREREFLFLFLFYVYDMSHFSNKKTKKKMM